MDDSNKNQIRIMAQYSIAKSFKGILRIAHIIDLIEGDPDVFLNPTYYGTPKSKIDISGKESKQKGVDSAFYSLKGDDTIKRYNSSDHLKNRRVPMTDSMGNYLNWNVGSDGITIGSQQELSNNFYGYNVFYQKENTDIPIYQKKFFPIFETKEIIIGKNNKQHRIDNKSVIGKPSLSIEGSNTIPQLIIENLYDKTEQNRVNKIFTENSVEITCADYVNLIESNKYKKIRTIYRDSKQYEQLYDVMMYRQNNWDYDNYRANHTLVEVDSATNQSTWVENDEQHLDDKFKVDANHRNDYNSTFTDYETGDILDCIADTQNIVGYVKKAIQTYLKGNIIQTPTGTVIWQYCSLQKWRGYGDRGSELGSGGTNIIPYFTGNRPTLETRVEAKQNTAGNENAMPFFASLVQGACKKINRLKKTGVHQINEKEETEEDVVKEDSKDKALIVQEIIPLYKRDYVLCDGSVYRIPFYPPFKNTNLLSLKENMDRFFELYFNIGYKYTPREKMMLRPLISNFKYEVDDEEGKKQTFNGYCLLARNAANFNNKKIIPKKFIKNQGTELQMESIPWKSNNDYRELIDEPCYFPNIDEPFTVSVSSSTYDNLKDTQVLFEQDLATILAITEIYNYYKTLGVEKPNYVEFYNSIKGLKLPQKYIFNTYLSKEDNISVPYTNNNITYKINIGRQVNSLSSQIRFYNNNTKKIEICNVVDLPMVNIFLQYFLCLDSEKVRAERDLINLFFTFFNYNFCVPSLLSQEKTPTFIGSGGYAENDENRIKLKKVVEWKCKYSHATVPHRHAVFGGKSVLDDLQVPIANIASHYKCNELTVGTNNIPNIANFYGGEMFKFRSYSKYGGWTYTLRQNFGNYIVNQYHPQMEAVNVDDKFSVNIMYNQGRVQYENHIEDKEKRKPHGWKTGSHRVFTGFKNKKSDNWDDITNVESFESEKYNKDNLDKSEIRKQYRDEQLRAWYGLLPYEDPRFDTSQPNRGLTSAPIKSTMQINITYKKLSDNKALYGSPQNNMGDTGWFSPEHITMLPLIKL